MSAPDFAKRPDKLNKYLESEAKAFIFAALSPDFLDRNGLEFLDEIEIPLKPEDILEMQKGGLDVNRLADNMSVILGVNTQFPHADAYIRFLKKYYTEQLCQVLCGKGRDALLAHSWRKACVYFRAALMLFSDSQDAMFGYASVCREWYLSLEGEDGQDELISILKSESTAYFEYLVLEHPDFAVPYYYLGFAYLNSALYAKTQAVWKRFMDLSDDSDLAEQRKEIAERLEELGDPVKIEGGINHILAGRYEEGLKILEPYINTDYDNWWPLHYYLAGAYRELGFEAEAIEGYKRVLQLSPSNIEAAENLADLYASAGDDEMAMKYINKADLFRKNKA